VTTPAALLKLQRDADAVKIDHSLATYLQALVAATRSSSTLAIGASPRAAKGLSRAARARALLNGRSYCIADDVHDLAIPLLSHRIRLAAHSEGYLPSRDETEAAVRDIVARIPVPL
jgi:MoxR-like ATPase